MKRSITFLFVTVSFLCYGQIGMTDVASPKKTTPLIIFDSTQNFLGYNNVLSYTGQTLFVLPEADDLQKYGYFSFFQYCQIDSNGELSSRLTPYENSTHKDLAMKYFIVDSIRPYTKRHGVQYLFFLTDVSDPQKKCLYGYEAKSKYSFPFCVVSHYNYLKNTYVGKQLIIKKDYLYSYDIKTGDSIQVSDETKYTWDVTDIKIVNNKYKPFAFILKHGNTETYICVNHVESNIGKRVFLKKEWDKYVSTYGLSMMECVLNQTIKVGMPKELLIMSWGEPTKINYASYGDQYIYGDYSKFVYLEGGKVTGWN